MAFNRRRHFGRQLVLGLTVLAGCAAPPAPAPVPHPAPQIRDLHSPRPRANPVLENRPLRDPPLLTSAELTERYDALEAKLLSEGSLRQDRGSLDGLSAADLAQNFIRIALFDEYTDHGGTFLASQSASRLRRWQSPVRIRLDFGASVPPDRRRTDQGEVRELIGELTSASGHQISLTEQPGAANFTVLVVDEDERLALRPTLRALVPGIGPEVVRSMLDLDPSTYCLVVAFSDPPRNDVYTRAVAIIRAEHPDLIAHGCFHEEITQGLGLANDSDLVRPSIFNDDEEFSLLTVQDKLMLKMLYDPRLHPGMTIEQARPVVEQIAGELLPAEDGPASPPPSP